MVTPNQTRAILRKIDRFIVRTYRMCKIIDSLIGAYKFLKEWLPSITYGSNSVERLSLGKPV